MKGTLTALALICSLTAFGQTSQKYLQNGITKHKQQDFKGAIKDYDKAIKEDKSNKDAYFNRGTCELALKILNLRWQILTRQSNLIRNL